MASLGRASTRVNMPFAQRRYTVAKKVLPSTRSMMTRLIEPPSARSRLFAVSCVSGRSGWRSSSAAAMAEDSETPTTMGSTLSVGMSAALTASSESDTGRSVTMEGMGGKPTMSDSMFIPIMCASLQVQSAA